MAASFEVASFFLHVCRRTVAMETNFHHFVSRYVFFLKSHGYDDIQTSNEFLLIFTINTPYTPNIFTGEWVNTSFCRHLHKSRSEQQAMDMMKDVSKYLFSRDGKNVNPSYMEDGPEMTKYTVNKLTALLAAAKFYYPGNSAINHIEKKRKKMSAERTSLLKQRRNTSKSQ